MNTPPTRDLEQLSAYLDGQLSPADRARLDARLVADPELRRLLDDLSQTRLLLRRTPRRRVPRNFVLTPKMAGIRPPVPRLVPALGWATAAAILLFVGTFATSLAGKVSFGPMAAAPMAAQATSAPVAADNGLGGGPPAATSAPTAAAAHAQVLAATQAPAEGVGATTATPAAPPQATAVAPSLLSAPPAASPEPTEAALTRTTKQPPVPSLAPPATPLLTPLQDGLIALAALIAALALTLTLASLRRWRRSAGAAGGSGQTREVLLLLAVLVLVAATALAVVGLVRGVNAARAEKQSSILPIETPVQPAVAGKGLPVDSSAPTPDLFSVPFGTDYTYSHSDDRGHNIMLQFPAGAFGRSTYVQFSTGLGAPSPDGFAYAGVGFQMVPVPDPLPLEKPVLVTLRYSAAEVEAVGDKNRLVLMAWNGEAWEQAGSSCASAPVYDRQVEDDTLRLAVCGMESYALFAPQP